MIEVFKDAEIAGSANNIKRFIEGIACSLSPGWTCDLEAEARAQRDAGIAYLMFVRQADDKFPAVALAMTRSDTHLKVVNIIPQKIGEITRAQSNALQDDFLGEGIRRLAADSGVLLHSTPSHEPLTNWVSDDAAKLLEAFSGAANKSTGSSHPCDFERWAAFLCRVHRDAVASGGRKLDGVTLHRWLVRQHGWGEEQASKLTSQFEFAMEMLKAYDGGDR
ncbi:MAG: hypothetical protein KGR26_02640 [Cyanobacteria bacterium REEB65]|nr:hypothetical protein [Cyanobacteria bacterium REEB65]